MEFRDTEKSRRVSKTRLVRRNTMSNSDRGLKQISLWLKTKSKEDMRLYQAVRKAAFDEEMSISTYVKKVLSDLLFKKGK